MLNIFKAIKSSKKIVNLRKFGSVNYQIGIDNTNLEDNANSLKQIDNISNKLIKQTSIMLDKNNKMRYIEQNIDLINNIDNFILTRVDYQKPEILNNLHILVKYMMVISENDQNKIQFINQIKDLLKNLDTISLIEICWYFCLINDKENKSEIYEIFAETQKNKISNILLKKSLDLKYKLSQFLYDADISGINLDEQLNLPDDMDILSFDTFRMEQYEDFRDQISKKTKINIGANKFFGIYNLGLYYEQKVLDLVIISSKNYEFYIHKLIRDKQLSLKGYKIVNVFVDRIPLTRPDFEKIRSLLSSSVP